MRQQDSIWKDILEETACTMLERYENSEHCEIMDTELYVC
jgi:hypothetical protein